MTKRTVEEIKAKLQKVAVLSMMTDGEQGIVAAWDAYEGYAHFSFTEDDPWLTTTVLLSAVHGALEDLANNVLEGFEALDKFITDKRNQRLTQIRGRSNN